MMSDELAEIFILLILGGILSFNVWLSWTRQQFTYKSRRYSRAAHPFGFWLLISLNTLLAAFLFIFAVVFSISLLRSSWT